MTLQPLRAIPAAAAIVQVHRPEHRDQEERRRRDVAERFLSAARFGGLQDRTGLGHDGIVQVRGHDGAQRRRGRVAANFARLA